MDVLGAFGRGCDMPTEINGSHWHCEAGGFGAGGFGVAQQGISLGVLSNLGAGGASCSWRCPAGSVAPAPPNPPGAWQARLIVRDEDNVCLRPTISP